MSVGKMQVAAFLLSIIAYRAARGGKGDYYEKNIWIAIGMDTWYGIDVRVWYG